ncbi:MAG: hypothetical protein KatS3mg088_182 [Patescibacteria group bacterium]|nr:MAG: hypothetical protein KatS3mg088_182 [Patescibacteria group bacterium]
MAALKRQKQINLLPKDKFSESDVGRIVFWFLSTFRIMVIVVELIVVAAFLSRFWLDSKNADLSDEIKQKEAQIRAFEETEKKFRELQKRLVAFSTLSSQTSTYSILGLISKQMPPKITLYSINFLPDEISVAGNTPTDQELAQFLVNLKSENRFEKITLAQLSPKKEDASILSFTIYLKVKNETNADKK